MFLCEVSAGNSAGDTLRQMETTKLRILPEIRYVVDVRVRRLPRVGERLGSYKVTAVQPYADGDATHLVIAKHIEVAAQDVEIHELVMSGSIG